MNEKLIIKGAREHNLKNIDLTLPRNKLIVFTGLSGSGKSSLAFDTIYAEGQRRYVESLSSYARLFLGQMEKPDVDYIEGLSPAISIDQKSTSNNPRSTVGTVTEIHDYMRLLYARVGIPHCPKCGRVIERQSIDQVVDRVMALDGRIQIIAPAVRAKKGEHAKLLEQIRKDGYVRVRVDGEVYDINEVPPLDKQKKHTIDVIVDRLIIKPGIEGRLAESMETAFAFGDGLAKVDVIGKEELIFSEKYSCPDCGISIEELTPRLFSFNSPHGACPKCTGLGVQMLIDPELIMPNPNLSIMDGGLTASGWNNVRGDSISRMYFDALAKRCHFKLTDPIKELPKEAIDAILYGTKGEALQLRYERNEGFGVIKREFEGIVNNLERRYRETQSPAMRADIEECMSEVNCPECNGRRLKKTALAVTVGGMNIAEFTELSIFKALEFIDGLELNEKDAMIAERIIKEIKARLGFLVSVGLGYLSLSRSAATLSGGESQRIRLATQIGSSLMGVLYILDEPSIGLHQRDNEKLLATLKQLRDLGNTLIVVEHDEDTMRAADWIVDVGPGAGVNGGRIVAAGTAEDICACPESITGQYLSGKKFIPVPDKRRAGNGRSLIIRGACENNLKNIDVEIPLGELVVVTGVSGSGKSSLINEILYKSLAAEKNRVKVRPGKCAGIEGMENVDKVIALDQSPIGRTPRSNPATYTGVFNDIRDLFASTQDAKLRGYGQGRFSFNVKGGRCEACSGDGLIKVEMHFLPDVYVPCDVCGGKRYNRETLEVTYRGKTISDVLDMSVTEALAFFGNIPQIKRKLQTLYDVGLGYVSLGQPATTLSGGEAQRLKLASEMGRVQDDAVFVFDEPTIGLHPLDVQVLLSVFDGLVAKGATVIVIEHDLDLIRNADYVIDMGPGGGDAGGQIVCAGTPSDIAACPASITGRYL